MNLHFVHDLITKEKRKAYSEKWLLEQDQNLHTYSKGF